MDNGPEEIAAIREAGLGLAAVYSVQSAEIAALRARVKALEARVAELEEAGEQLKAQLNGQDMVLLVEIAKLRHDNSTLREALGELRCRFHAAGRRPEECHDMSIIDDALAAAAPQAVASGDAVKQCPKCGGAGWEYARPHTCPTCNGTGEVADAAPQSEVKP